MAALGQGQSELTMDVTYMGACRNFQEEGKPQHLKNLTILRHTEEKIDHIFGAPKSFALL